MQSAALLTVSRVRCSMHVLCSQDGMQGVNADLQERFAAGLASHLSRSLPVQRGAAAPSAQQQQQPHQQQPMEALPGSQSSLPTAGISVYGDSTSAYMADDSVLDVSRGRSHGALNRVIWRSLGTNVLP